MGRLIGWIVAVAGLLALVYAAKIAGQPEAPAAAEQGGFEYRVPVLLTRVERGDLEPMAQLSAEVRSSRRADLSFSGSGRLGEVLVREADEVQTGDLLVQLVAGDEEHELARAKAALRLAELEEQLVQAGERAEEKERLLAELEATRAEATLAQLEEGRAGKMLDERLIPASEQERRKAASDAAGKRSAAAEQTYQRALAGARPEDLAIAHARVEEAAARVAFAQHRLDETKLRAPWPGSIVERMLSSGDYVSPGTAVFELVDLKNLELAIEVPAHYAGRLGTQPAARLHLRGRGDFELTKPLDAVIPAADPRARSFKALIRLGEDDDPANVLRPGMSVEAELLLAPVRDALVVPSDCILAGEHGRYVVTAGQTDGVYHAGFVPVVVLADVQGRSAVEALGAPLAAGDELVLVGADNAYPGALLLVRGAHEGQPAAGELDGGAVQ